MPKQSTRKTTPSAMGIAYVNGFIPNMYACPRCFVMCEIKAIMTGHVVGAGVS